MVSTLFIYKVMCCICNKPIINKFTSAENICATSGEPNSCESDKIPNDFLKDFGIYLLKI